MSFMLEKNTILSLIGFDNLKDFVGSVVVNKGVLFVGGAVAGLSVALDQFIAINIYSPSRGVYLLFLATILDIMLGVSVAVKESTFQARKLSKAMIRLVVQICFVGLLNQSYIVWDFVAHWMVSTLLLSFVLTTFWSAFKNAYELGWIQRDTYFMLEKLLSIDEVVNQFLKHLFKNTKKKDE